MDPSCIFCNIASGRIPTTLLHEDDELIAFSDINPQAPVHLLIIPKRHLSTLNDATGEEQLLGKMGLLAVRLARAKGIESSGYRCVINCNADGGQSVYHLHMHLLGGRTLGWPPG